MNRFIFNLLVLLFPLICNAQIQPFSECDEDPVFLSSKNGNAYDLDDYVCKHFNYPKDQMEFGKFVRSTNIKILIDGKGNVKSLECFSNRITESTKKELWRVLSKTIWRPGYKDGRPISSWYNKNDIKLISETSELPHNAETPFMQIKKYVGKESERFTNGITHNELNKRIRKYESFYEVFPMNTEINIPYIKMLASINNHTKLKDVLLFSASDFWGPTFSDEFKNRTQAMKDSAAWGTRNFKSLIFARLLASAYSFNNSKEQNKIFSKSVIHLIGKCIEYQNLGHSIIKEDEAYKYRHARRLSIDAAKEAERNTTDLYYKDKIANEWSYNKVNEIAGKMTNQGLLNSNSYIHDLELRSVLWDEKKLSSNDYYLLAIRSLATRLSEGEDAEKAQLISMIMDEKVSDKVRKQLQGLYDQVDALRLTHDEIVNNVIMYAPVQDPAKTKEENKAVATEFYRIRDAINNVYHIDWLEKK